MHVKKEFDGHACSGWMLQAHYVVYGSSTLVASDDGRIYTHQDIVDFDPPGATNVRL